MHSNRLRASLALALFFFVGLGSFLVLSQRAIDRGHSGADEDGLVIVPPSSTPPSRETLPPGANTPSVATAPPVSPSTSGVTINSPLAASIFFQAALARGRDIISLCAPNDPVNRAVLTAYGAIYVSDQALSVPESCIPTRLELEAFYQTVKFEKENLGGVVVSFQRLALDAFKQARSEASAQGLSITPTGTRASLRDYDGTVEIWQRNLGEGIRSARGLSDTELRQLRSSDVRESVGAVLAVESRGILIGPGGGKSILQIAAPPGTSQHISGLSIDISEHESAAVRAVMAKYGFYQTIANDFTHFTYLGIQSDLASLGLNAVTIDGRVFYVPKL